MELSLLATAFTSIEQSPVIWFALSLYFFLGSVWWIGITVIVEGSQKKVKFNNINYCISWDLVPIF